MPERTILHVPTDSSPKLTDTHLRRIKSTCEALHGDSSMHGVFWFAASHTILPHLNSPDLWESCMGFYPVSIQIACHATTAHFNLLRECFITISDTIERHVMSVVNPPAVPIVPRQSPSKSTIHPSRDGCDAGVCCCRSHRCYYFHFSCDFPTSSVTAKSNDFLGGHTHPGSQNPHWYDGVPSSSCLSHVWIQAYDQQRRLLVPRQR